MHGDVELARSDDGTCMLCTVGSVGACMRSGSTTLAWGCRGGNCTCMRRRGDQVRQRHGIGAAWRQWHTVAVHATTEAEGAPERGAVHACDARPVRQPWARSRMAAGARRCGRGVHAAEPSSEAGGGTCIRTCGGAAQPSTAGVARRDPDASEAARQRSNRGSATRPRRCSGAGSPSPTAARPCGSLLRGGPSTRVNSRGTTETERPAMATV